MKSLVVDDELVPRTVLQRLLQTMGTCDVATNAAEALTAVRQTTDKNEPYDFICLDIEMPGGSGQDLLKELRQMETIDDHITRIVMTSSHSQAEQVKTAFFNGSDGFLVKPVDLDRLVRKIKDLGIVIPATPSA